MDHKTISQFLNNNRIGHGICPDTGEHLVMRGTLNKVLGIKWDGIVRDTYMPAEEAEKLIKNHLLNENSCSSGQDHIAIF